MRSLAGEKPVIEGRAHVFDVQMPCCAGGKADSNRHGASIQWTLLIVSLKTRRPLGSNSLLYSYLRFASHFMINAILKYGFPNQG